jgi:hypothetical protein
VQTGINEGFGWFLRQNTCVDTHTNIVPPFFDPAAAPVHQVQ